MTLDNAIEHCLERANGGDQCAVEHWQLAQWLDELRRLRMVEHAVRCYISADRCEGCACKAACNDGDVDECWQMRELRELLGGRDG